MATFATDLFSGKQYLFDGDFTNSGMTTFTGITSANNGLTCISPHRVKLGGTLICTTTITRGVGNTAGIEYGGDYSASFSNRSLIDKGYADTKLNISIFNNYTGITAPNLYLGINACANDSTKLNNRLSTYYLNTGSTALCSTTAGNALCLGSSSASCYQQKAGINTYTGTTAPNQFANRTTYNNHTGDTTIHYKQSGITITENQVTNLPTDLSYLQTEINQLSQIQTATIFYIEHLPANVGTYERMTTSQLTTSGYTESTTGLNNNTVLIDEFITDSDIPSVTSIPSGLWTFHSHAQWSSVTGLNFLHWDTYKYSTGGTLTFLFRTSTPDIGVTTLQEYQISQIYSGTTMNATDRLVLRILAQTTGGAKTATLHYAGTDVFGFIQPPLLVNMSPQWASIQNKPAYLGYVSGLTSAAAPLVSPSFTTQATAPKFIEGAACLADTYQAKFPTSGATCSISVLTALPSTFSILNFCCGILKSIT
jgi:hypothetical protein